MSFQIGCPSCQATLMVGDDLCDKQVRCARCSAVMQVPGGPSLDTTYDSSGMGAAIKEVPADNPSLGRREAEFRGSIWGGYGSAWLGLICTLFGALLIGSVIVGLIRGVSDNRIARPGGWGLLLLVSGVGLLRGTRVASRTCVELYAEGIVLREGTRATTCQWTDVLTVVEKEAVGQNELIRQAMKNENRAFRLTLKSGKMVVLKSYIAGLTRLGTIIKQKTLPHLLRRHQAELDRDGRSDFGPISVHRGGIEVNDENLRWAEVEAVARDKGCVKVYRRGWATWRKLKLADVPNAHVLAAMAEARRSTQGHTPVQEQAPRAATSTPHDGRQAPLEEAVPPATGLQIACPSCRATLMVPNDHRGKQIRCSRCNAIMQVPVAPAAAPAANEKPCIPPPLPISQGAAKFATGPPPVSRPAQASGAPAAEEERRGRKRWDREDHDDESERRRAPRRRCEAPATLSRGSSVALYLPFSLLLALSDSCCSGRTARQVQTGSNGL